jgi:hypothetical protein
MTCSYWYPFLGFGRTYLEKRLIKELKDKEKKRKEKKRNGCQIEK